MGLSVVTLLASPNATNWTSSTVKKPLEDLGKKVGLSHWLFSLWLYSVCSENIMICDKLRYKVWEHSKLLVRSKSFQFVNFRLRNDQMLFYSWFHCIFIVPHRVMYWTDWGTTPRIECALLNGSRMTDVITTNITQPFGLAMDYQDPDKTSKWFFKTKWDCSFKPCCSDSREEVVYRFRLV